MLFSDKTQNGHISAWLSYNNLYSGSMSTKKQKAYILEVIFKSEEDLKNYVEKHFGSEKIARTKDGFDQMHLRSYTKKVYGLKPKSDPDTMAHYWVAVGNDHETVDEIIDRWKAEAKMIAS
mgnify:FL=1